jgi:chitinase
VSVLTHINYAFGYINPGTYQIVTMDPDTDPQLFADLMKTKLINPDLEIWLSIGGWTFSDNGTATQPLFGEIARDSSKRQLFADNLVAFLTTYGYDGKPLTLFR